MEGMVDYSKTWRFRDLLKLELLPFYLASFEESPESYLAPSRGVVWGTRRSARHTESLGFV